MEAREKHRTMINCWGSDLFTTQKALYIDVSQSCILIVKLFKLFLTTIEGEKTEYFTIYLAYNIGVIII